MCVQVHLTMCVHVETREGCWAYSSTTLCLVPLRQVFLLSLILALLARLDVQKTPRTYLPLLSDGGATSTGGHVWLWMYQRYEPRFSCMWSKYSYSLSGVPRHYLLLFHLNVWPTLPDCTHLKPNFDLNVWLVNTLVDIKPSHGKLPTVLILLVIFRFLDYLLTASCTSPWIGMNFLSRHHIMHIFSMSTTSYLVICNELL